MDRLGSGPVWHGTVCRCRGLLPREALEAQPESSKQGMEVQEGQEGEEGRAKQVMGETGERRGRGGARQEQERAVKRVLR